jgi:hypothetical protein
MLIPRQAIPGHFLGHKCSGCGACLARRGFRTALVPLAPGGAADYLDCVEFSHQNRPRGIR